MNQLESDIIDYITAQRSIDVPVRSSYAVGLIESALTFDDSLRVYSILYIHGDINTETARINCLERMKSFNDAVALYNAAQDLKDQFLIPPAKNCLKNRARSLDDWLNIHHFAREKSDIPLREDTHQPIIAGITNLDDSHKYTTIAAVYKTVFTRGDEELTKPIRDILIEKATMFGHILFVYTVARDLDDTPFAERIKEEILNTATVTQLDTFSSVASTYSDGVKLKVIARQATLIGKSLRARLGKVARFLNEKYRKRA